MKRRSFLGLIGMGSMTALVATKGPYTENSTPIPPSTEASKGCVGLGRVVPYTYANAIEMEAETSNDAYITPIRLAQNVQ